MMEFNIYIL